MDRVKTGDWSIKNNLHLKTLPLNNIPALLNQSRQPLALERLKMKTLN
jgi:hypothetical protein